MLRANPIPAAAIPFSIVNISKYTEWAIDFLDLRKIFFGLIINTASLIEISDQWGEDQAIKINEPVKPVRLSEFYCVEKDSTVPLDYVMQDVMPEEVILQISLPKSWALLPTPEKFFEIQKTYFFLNWVFLKLVFIQNSVYISVFWNYIFILRLIMGNHLDALWRERQG